MLGESLRLTGALLDRLTHHVHILEMNGESYRLNQNCGRQRLNAAYPHYPTSACPVGPQDPPTRGPPPATWWERGVPRAGPSPGLRRQAANTAWPKFTLHPAPCCAAVDTRGDRPAAYSVKTHLTIAASAGSIARSPWIGSPSGPNMRGLPGSRRRCRRPTCRPPPVLISPEDTGSSPAIIRNSVVFPYPEGPTKTTNSPS